MAEKQEQLSDGKPNTRPWYEQEKEELLKIKEYVGENRYQKGKFDLATQLFNELIFDEKIWRFSHLKGLSIYKTKKQEAKTNNPTINLNLKKLWWAKRPNPSIRKWMAEQPKMERH